MSVRVRWVHFSELLYLKFQNVGDGHTETGRRQIVLATNCNSGMLQPNALMMMMMNFCRPDTKSIKTLKGVSGCRQVAIFMIG